MSSGELEQCNTNGTRGVGKLFLPLPRPQTEIHSHSRNSRLEPLEIRPQNHNKHRRRNGGAPGACAPPSFHELLYNIAHTLYVVLNCAPQSKSPSYATDKLQYLQETSMDCDGSLVTALYTVHYLNLLQIGLYVCIQQYFVCVFVFCVLIPRQTSILLMGHFQLKIKNYLSAVGRTSASGLSHHVHSKSEVVVLTINLSCWSQMSEPVSCMDTVNC